jgi:hypothetical protein
MVKLDYSASMPITDSAKIEASAAKNPPGDYRYKDFVPNPSAAGKVKPYDGVNRKNFQNRPVARYEQDYINPDDAKSRRASEKESIIGIAKSIYDGESNKRRQFELATQLINSTSDEDKAQPSKELQRAIKMVERYKPMTKNEALTLATQQYYGLRG